MTNNRLGSSQAEAQQLPAAGEISHGRQQNYMALVDLEKLFDQDHYKKVI